MKTIWIGLVCLVFLSGCLEVEEKLTINPDGSGILKIEQFVPRQVLEMAIGAMGGMVGSDNMPNKTQWAKFWQEGGEGEERDIPQTGKEGEEELFKKAQAVGLKIEIIEKKARKTQDGIKLFWGVKFDNVVKLAQSGISHFKFDIFKNPSGGITLAMQEDKETAQKLEAKTKEQAGCGKVNPAVNPEAQKMLEQLGHVKLSFSVTMPNKITEAAGLFKRTSDTNVQFDVEGNILANPEVLKQIYSPEITKTKVSCSGAGLKLSPGAKTGAPASGREVSLRLKKGGTVKGAVLEETADHIKVDVLGVPVTYYRDEIETVD